MRHPLNRQLALKAQDFYVLLALQALRGPLAAYLAERFTTIVNHPDFDNTLPGLVEYDELYDERIHSVRNRARRIATLKID